MAHTPASYHAPALHYRAKGICSCNHETNRSGYSSIRSPHHLSRQPTRSHSHAPRRLHTYCTGQMPDRGYEAIEIELRKRLALTDFLTFYRIIRSFIYHITKI